MNIEVFELRTARFWEMMGPFFASKGVRKEMPFLHDEPDMVWFIAITDGNVAAFGSAQIDAKNVGHLRNLYVAPAVRRNGYAGALMDARLRHLRERGVTIVRTTRRVSKTDPFSEHYGFSVVGTSAGFQTLQASLALWDTVKAEEARKSGYDAAAKIIKLGKKRLQVIKPTTKDRDAHKEYWSPYLAGWMERVRERATELGEWINEEEQATSEPSAS